MKIAQLFGKGKTVFSCEVFPPKKTSPVDSIYKTLDGLKDIHPDFISVTFGAGGSAGGVSTAEVADYIQNELHVPTLAHLICMGNDETRASSRTSTTSPPWPISPAWAAPRGRPPRSWLS